MIEITILFIINCPWINQRITMSKIIRFSQKKSSVLAKANSVQNCKLRWLKPTAIQRRIQIII